MYLPFQYLLSAGLVLLGAIINVANFAYLVPAQFDSAKYISFSFVFCVLGGSGYLVTGVVLIRDVRQRWYL